MQQLISAVISNGKAAGDWSASFRAGLLLLQSSISRGEVLLFDKVSWNLPPTHPRSVFRRVLVVWRGRNLARFPFWCDLFGSEHSNAARVRTKTSHAAC